jgi:hypothetical protein
LPAIFFSGVVASGAGGVALGVGVAASGGVHTGGDSAHRTEEENNARKKMGKSLMAN